MNCAAHTILLQTIDNEIFKATISARTRNALINAFGDFRKWCYRCPTLAQILTYRKEKLLMVRGIGKRGIAELEYLRQWLEWPKYD